MRTAAILFIGCLLPFVFAKADGNVSVELEWNSVEGASAYFLEIQDLRGRTVKKVRSKSPVFKLTISPGQYRFRARAEVSDFKGEWSPLSKLEVAPRRPPAPPSPPAETVKVSKNGKTANLPLSWTPVAGADSYEVEIQDLKTGESRRLVVPTPRAEPAMTAGRYRTRLRAISGGLKGKPTKWSPMISVLPEALSAPEVKEFAENETPDEIEYRPQATVEAKFRLERQEFLSERWNEVESPPLRNHRLAAHELPPGRYRWTLWSEDEEWGKSPPQTIFFVVKPREARLDRAIEGALSGSAPPRNL